MKPREFVVGKLDVAAFAKQAAELSGQSSLVDLPRLAASVLAAAPGAPVNWQLRGELRAVRGRDPQVWLHLEASTAVMLECQRCLSPVETPLAAQRSFLFVASEAEAAALDAELDDDVLILERSLDALALVEDELLLALPLVPRHEVCPQPLLAPGNPVDESDDAPHPFAALAALKRGGLPN